MSQLPEPAKSIRIFEDAYMSNRERAWEANYIRTQMNFALTDPDLYARQLESAWEAWEEESCLERTGHEFWLQLNTGYAELKCIHCGAEPYPDCSDLIVGAFPVSVNVSEHRYQTFEGDDIDLYVEVTPRT